MVHTYEVLVDTRECLDQLHSTFQSETTRYEIDAESKFKANAMARIQARSERPQCTEYDVRVTRLLK
ncbi:MULTISPECIES: hypothetical protein [Nostocales]|uniref:Uncharacterized protein n=3 Tax=Nostocales TaxID=1161 RepID=A0A0C1N9H3_9CYAN|nr:hypothetical protein [Tolypothrix bouteillei]KAF3884940.1 hypothetical protein DA73_0400005300 [Tolypothrix bouteillei VB521301]